MKRFLLLICACSMIFTPKIMAKEINHSYSNFGSDVTLEDNVNGTSLVAGESTDVTGRVNGINVMAGNNVKFDGQSDYLVALGNSIKIKGKVSNDTFIAGNIIDIKEEANLDRDVIIAGSDVDIRGNFGRDATIYAAKVVIDGGSILGNVKIYAEDITISDSTSISGSVSVPEDAKTKISSNITNIIKTDAIHTEDADVFVQFMVNKIWSFMGLIFVFAIMTVLIPHVFSLIQKKYDKVDLNVGIETFTKGLVFLIIVPVISIVCFVIPFGTPMSLILIALYAIAVYLSSIFTAYLIGYKVWQRYFKSDINMLLVGILGLAILFVLDFVPIVRGLCMIISLMFGIGIMIELFNSRKKA